MNQISQALAAIIGMIGLLFVTIFWGGFVGAYTASVLWAWFAVPIFGLPALSIAQAYGVGLTIRMLKGVDIHKEDNKREFGETVARALLLPPLICGMVLLVGWVVKQFL